HGVGIFFFHLLRDQADARYRITLVAIGIDVGAVVHLADRLDIFLQSLVGQHREKRRYRRDHRSDAATSSTSSTASTASATTTNARGPGPTEDAAGLERRHRTGR